MKSIITDKIVDIYETSDIHFENFNDLYPRKIFWNQLEAIKPINTNRFNVLILAGDIFKLKSGVLASKIIAEFRCRFDLILYIPGNHEYYGSRLESKALKGIDLLHELDGVHVLDNDSLVLKGRESEIAFIGSTLWSDIASYKQDADYVSEYLGQGTYRFRDFKVIRKKAVGRREYIPIKPIDQTLRHKESVKYLEDAMKLHQQANRILLVITHHAPSFKSASRFKKDTPLQYKDSIRKLNSEGIVPKFSLNNGSELDSFLEYADKGTRLYCTDLESLIGKYKPQFWFHGHIHEKISYYIGETLVQSDPYGYIDRKNLRQVKEQIPLKLSIK